MNLDGLSSEERKALAQEALEAERAEQAKIEKERGSYKELVSKVVDDVFPALQELSAKISVAKRGVYEEFAEVMRIKAELYNVKELQNTHTFTNADSSKRITLGYRTVDSYDDTVNEGIAKVRAYINSLAKDAESELLVEAINKLMAKDAKGSLKPSRVIQLRQMANKSGNTDFADGVRIIEDAYSPVRSKMFIKAEYVDSLGKWISVPLGVTEAE